MANGTDAIEVALRALGVGSGDECILPANTFIATAEAVSRSGATPVLVDCADDGTYLINTEAVAAAVTPRTKAIIPVHLYGQAAPVERLMPLAEEFGAWVVEDAAQSQGARRNGKSAGSARARGGDQLLPRQEPGRIRRRRGGADQFRRRGRADADDRGSRLATEVRARGDRLQQQDGYLAGGRSFGQAAAAGRMERGEAGRCRQVRCAAFRLRRGCLARTLAGNEHVWHLYVVRVPNRDRVLKELHAAGIGAGIHYAVPIHLTTAFAHLGYGRGSFPVAERTAGNLLSLPLFAEITAAQQERVVSVLKSAI